MREHHAFLSSLLENTPRPSENEIRIKAPGMRHEERTLTPGGRSDG